MEKGQGKVRFRFQQQKVDLVERGKRATQNGRFQGTATRLRRNLLRSELYPTGLKGGSWWCGVNFET